MTKLPFVLKRDILLIFITLSLAVGLMLFFGKKNESKEKYAEISVNGEVVKTIYLGDATNQTFSLENIDGVEFEIENGKIRIKTSDCADKLCVKTGFIENPNESAICLPKRLTLTIRAESADFDAVVG